MPILLIRSREYVQISEKDFHLSWADFSSEFRVETVDAGHEDFLLEPDVVKVARVLDASLIDVREELGAA